MPTFKSHRRKVRTENHENARKYWRAYDDSAEPPDYSNNYKHKEWAGREERNFKRWKDAQRQLQRIKDIRQTKFLSGQEDGGE